MREIPLLPVPRGFTLVEIVSVLVILGIVAAIGSSFVVSTVNNYKSAETKAKLIAKGRLAIEQMTRQLRIALPNAVRVSASGNCLEFFPVVAGANYLNNLPDEENGAAQTSSIPTSPFTLGLGSAVHVAVAPFNANEVYTTANPSARANLASTSSSPPSITLSANHRFIRNSVYRRLYITDNPKRFCVSGGNLWEYSGYGLSTSALNDNNPGAASNLITSSVVANGTAFSLSPGSEERNTGINISLQFSERGSRVNLENKVLIRNVP